MWRLRFKNGTILKDGFKTRRDAITWHNNWLDEMDYQKYSQEQFDNELWTSIECY
jgi:hypothetical protein